MVFQITPYMSVGSIEFGMAPNDVRRIVGSEPIPFKRTDRVEYPSDMFENDGIFAYYDKNGNLEAVELTSPAKVMLRDIALLEEAYINVLGKLISIDPELHTDGDGLTSYKMGIGIYAPDNDEDSKCLPQAVIAFRHGYYD